LREYGKKWEESVGRTVDGARVSEATGDLAEVILSLLLLGVELVSRQRGESGRHVDLSQEATRQCEGVASVDDPRIEILLSPTERCREEMGQKTGFSGLK